MTLRTSIIRTAAGLALSLLGTAAAGAATVDYVGFAWEDGGLPASAPGDQFALAAVITQIDPLFEVDLGSAEGTVYMTGLTSTGATVDPVSGTTTIAYTGGTIAVYADPLRNSDWGVDPANGTVPSTFTDGELVFSGDFTGFTVQLAASGAGVFEGWISGTGGSALAGPCANCAYTVSGIFTTDVGAQIPQGYDLQTDGTLEVESAVPTRDVSWGSFKQRYDANR